MKSINVKKIASVAAGAAMIGAAFAGAVAVDDAGLAGYKFFSGSEPNVKIVVGSQAGASDGVNAANIAAMIGNLAYESKDVYVVGTDGLSCGGSGGALSNGQCVADVSTPGVNTATAYLMSAYVEDRIDTNADSNRSLDYAFYGPGSTANAKLISQDHTNVLSMPNSGAIQNAKNLDVKQEQRVYLGAYNYYDTTAKVVKAKDVRTIYEVTFSDPLPACWDTTKTYALCTTNSDKLDRTHTKINFLGDQWVVVSFTVSGGAFTTIKLGKETAYKPFMSIGDEITAPNGVKAKLTDITPFAFGTLNQPKTTFDIFDENDQNIGTAILMPGEEYADNGIYLHVYDATTGVAGTSYAEVSMFSDTLELSSGNKIPAHGNWKVTLTSATVDTTEGLQKIQLYDDVSTNTLAAGDAVNLITNTVGYKFNYLGMQDKSVDTLSFSVEKPGQITLAASTYLTADFIKVTSARSNAFKFESSAVSDSYVYVTSAAATLSPANTTYGTITMNGTYTDSGSSSGFGDGALQVLANGTLGNTTYSYLFHVTYTDTQGTAGRTCDILLGDDGAAAGYAFSNTSCSYGIADVTAVTVNYTVKEDLGFTLSTGYIPSGTVYYYKSSDSTNPYHVWARGSVPYWYSTTESATLSFTDPAGVSYWVAIPEITEDNAGLTSTVAANRYLAFLYDQTLRQFVNTAGSTTIDKAGYEATAGAAIATTAPNQEANYVTYRGNVFKSISATSASMEYAESIRHGEFTLTSGDATGDGMSSSVTAGIGDFLLDQDGYTVEVTDVTGTSTGGNSSSTGVTGIESLLPSQDTAYDMTPLDTSAAPLVVLDTSSMASSSAQVITIGGQLVNTVSAQALSGITVASGDDPMVKVVGSKIVVAGYTAADTTSATNALIEWLAENRDAIQR